MHVSPEGQNYRAISSDDLFRGRHARSRSLGYVCPDASCRIPAARGSFALRDGANHNDSSCSRAGCRLCVTSR